jgi:GTP cyclohydrolase I
VSVSGYSRDKKVMDAFRTIVEFAGGDLSDPSVKDTPRRLYDMYVEMFKNQSVEALDRKVTQFESVGYDGMILVKDINFTSFCEHHMLPFMGVAHIAYIPKSGGNIVGLSKLARIVDHFASRMQVQERLTAEVCNYIVEKLDPLGTAVIIEAEHMCMALRGVHKHGASTRTASLNGVFFEDGNARNELYQMIGGK